MAFINTKCVAVFVALAIPSVGTVAKEAKMTALQIQQMQTKDVEVSKSIAFSSVMSVLQDSGYRIGSADKLD